MPLWSNGYDWKLLIFKSGFDSQWGHYDNKICKDCGLELDVSMFYPQRKRGSYQAYCKSCSNIRRVLWARKNTHKTKQYALKYIYGLSKIQYDDLLDKQDNSCKICKKIFGETNKPRVDHDHSCCGSDKACTKCVRGLLCNRCNLFLGFYENYNFMIEVRDYLGLDNQDQTL